MSTQNLSKYKIRRELRAIGSRFQNSLNSALNWNGTDFKVHIQDHVADRLLDRSTNIIRDLRNINYLLQRIDDTYLGNFLYLSQGTDIVLYTKYSNRSANECFAICGTFRTEEIGTTFAIRTFIPEYKSALLKERVVLEIKPKKKVYFNPTLAVSSLIYSERCPESLRHLRGS